MFHIHAERCGASALSAVVSRGESRIHSVFIAVFMMSGVWMGRGGGSQGDVRPAGWGGVVERGHRCGVVVRSQATHAAKLRGPSSHAEILTHSLLIRLRLLHDRLVTHLLQTAGPGRLGNGITSWERTTVSPIGAI